MKRKGAPAPLAVGQLRVAHGQIYVGYPSAADVWIHPGDMFIVLSINKGFHKDSGTAGWVALGMMDKTVRMASIHFIHLLSDLVAGPQIEN
jgi:hypothetical protein